MTAQKGHKKAGGRQRGTPNKTTAKIKACIVKIVSENVEQIKADLEQLQPKDRLTIIEKLLAYCIPKQSTTTVKADLETIIERIENE